MAQNLIPKRIEKMHKFGRHQMTKRLEGFGTGWSYVTENREVLLETILQKIDEATDHGSQSALVHLDRYEQALFLFINPETGKDGGIHDEYGEEPKPIHKFYQRLFDEHFGNGKVRLNGYDGGGTIEVKVSN